VLNNGPEFIASSLAQVDHGVHEESEMTLVGRRWENGRGGVDLGEFSEEINHAIVSVSSQNGTKGMLFIDHEVNDSEDGIYDNRLDANGETQVAGFETAK
jgi:hypothetical protein